MYFSGIVQYKCRKILMFYLLFRNYNITFASIVLECV